MFRVGVATRHVEDPTARIAPEVMMVFLIGELKTTRLTG